MAKLLLVDDHTMVREGLAGQLATESDFTVVAQASDAAEAIDRAIETSPDIVIMDIDMPGMSSFTAARTILLRRPEARIVFLSAHQHDEYIEQAIAVEARGYVLKKGGLKELKQAIRTVIQGGLYYSPSVLSRLVIQGDTLQLRAPAITRLTTLSKREKELLRLLASGMSVREAARVMSISPKTVDNQKVNLMKKLDIHDRVELARFAIREGLVAP
jgi:DNA-binding NarL/FixJ family response regulator